MIVSLILLMSVALLFGGATKAGFGSDILAQLISLVTLSYAVMAMPTQAAAHLRAIVQSRSGRLAAGLLLGLVGLHLFQLVPLPVAWTSGGPLGSDGLGGSISRVPHATGAALASLLPPVAVFALMLTCRTAHRQAALYLVLAIGIVSLVLGFLQVAQGPNSALRFYEITNPFEAVGFFANRNHFASFLCLLLVLVSVWILDILNHPSNRLPVLPAAGALACLVAVLTGLMMARSRAAVVLAMIVFVSACLIYWLSRRRLAASGSARTPRNYRWLAAGVVTALAIAVQLGLGRMLTRFEKDPVDDLRWTFSENGLSLALSSLPFGTGIGSFVPAYATFEHTSDLFTAFANRAHNDWVEFAIEGGLPAIALMVCFLFWFAGRVLSCPREPGLRRQQHIAGSLIIVVLLLHSIVDYPLRTTALATVFAFACALLTPPLPDSSTATDKGVDDTYWMTKDAARGEAPGTWSPIASTQKWPDAWQRE